MDITHNKINNAIAEMERLVSKGQTYSKWNKERQLRAVLRDMRVQQKIPLVFREVCFYFWLWVKAKIKKVR